MGLGFEWILLSCMALNRLNLGKYGATVYSGHAGFFSSNSRDVGGSHSVTGFFLWLWRLADEMENGVNLGLGVTMQRLRWIAQSSAFMMFWGECI